MTEKVVFEELGEKAYCLHFIINEIDNDKHIECCVYAAVAESIHVGPGDDDYETAYNLIDYEGNVVGTFANAKALFCINTKSKNVEFSYLYFSLDELEHIVEVLIKIIFSHANAILAGEELPNEAEFVNNES